MVAEELTVSLNIDLPPEAEKQIRNEAQRRGIPVEQFAGEILQRNLPTYHGSLWRSLTPEEWIRRTDEWAAGHADWPVLPPGADSRESIYEERMDVLLGRHQHTPEVEPSDGSE